MKKKHFWLLLMGSISILTAGIVYFQRHAVLRWMGTRLLPQKVWIEPPWDAIIVLSGRPYERSLRAAELYHQSPALLIALGGAYNDDLLAIGYEPAQECAFTASALKSLCIPDSSIQKECIGTSTYEEILYIRQLCVKRKWKRIMIVSSPFHGRRIELLAEKWLSRDSIQWAVAAAQPLHYHPTHWWESENGALAVFEEYVKTLYYAWKGYL
ncbi:MAG: YdcF family protein [Bacteroidia bacterium]|nr:YdcF family protein [Bacteroidia bacterium]MCX7764268.1 YdcF family protein [Bacteroidia bacterium]MDW8057674.1 YdcF family protein [Bacteroidia bacterium]